MPEIAIKDPDEALYYEHAWQVDEKKTSEDYKLELTSNYKGIG